MGEVHWYSEGCNFSFLMSFEEKRDSVVVNISGFSTYSWKLWEEGGLEPTPGSEPRHSLSHSVYTGEVGERARIVRGKSGEQDILLFSLEKERMKHSSCLLFTFFFIFFLIWSIYIRRCHVYFTSMILHLCLTFSLTLVSSAEWVAMGMLHAKNKSGYVSALAARGIKVLLCLLWDLWLLL